MCFYVLLFSLSMLFSQPFRPSLLSPSNLIEVSSLHFQELVYGDVGADRCDDNSEHHYRQCGDGKVLP